MAYNEAKEIADALIETQLVKENDRNLLMDVLMSIERKED